MKYHNRIFYFSSHPLGPDEYFYRHTRQNNTNIDQQQSQISSNSTIASNDARIGELDEFDKMIQRYQAKHSTK